MVAKWTGEYEFTLDVVLGQMLRRSRELRLRAVGGDRQLRMDFAVLRTVKTMHIGLAIDRVNRLDFLTVEEKQDIFYDNAAKFLGLTAEEIARHHR